jgi:aminopeptidase N
MRKWAIEASPQGPIYLGYRLGHIKGDGRTFRAVLYNKAAMVLHMLRRLVGDEAFFGGVRKFYTDWRFRKAGTDDFRAAMESVSGKKLDAFFEAWVYGFDIPRVKFTYEVAGTDLQITLEHHGAVMPVPVTVTITYSTGETQNVVVPVTERVATRAVPLRTALRQVEVNQDHAALAEFEK